LDKKLFSTTAHNVPFSWTTKGQTETASSLDEQNNIFTTSDSCHGLDVTFALLGRYAA